MAAALQEELLAVPGIAGAEVASDQGVAGVRVQLAVGADPDAVGAAVRRILAEHGMRPTVTEDDEPEGIGPPPPPGAPGSVVSFPLVGEHAKADAAATAVGRGSALESVAVEETLDGIVVLARSTDGHQAERTLQGGATGMDGAVVAAVAELNQRESVSLVVVTEQAMGDAVVITVLLTDEDMRHHAGAAVQAGGRAFAVARATWAALTARV